jgi:hypothetical protein
MSAAEPCVDLSRLSNALKVSLALLMAVAAASLWSGWLEIDLLQRAARGEAIPDGEAAASEIRQGIVGGAYFVTFALTAIMFLRLIYLSNRNARILGANGMRFTPAWAVGWYFVPIASLWKPYQAVKEIFKASHPDFGTDWQQAPSPGVLPLWWMLWVISSAVAQGVFRAVLRADTIGELLFSSWVMLISDALDVPLAVTVMVVVGRLSTWQSEKRRRVASVGA